ncbi:hypothetical protein EOL70_13510 [Leucothrix sargassi]|nr:hypothetical protein EOL70_13510 [Leucothrix sargassi]
MADNKLTINIGSRLDSRFSSPFKQAESHVDGVNRSLTELDKNGQLKNTHKSLGQLNTEAKQLKLSTRLVDGFSSSLSKLKTGAAILGVVVGTLGGGMMGQATSGVIALNKELQITEKQLGVSTEAMQVWSMATQPLGFEMEKVRDIFKDTSDKIGDFVANGGGEAKDIVEKLGLDIEKLKNQAPDKILLSIGHALSTVQGITNNEKVFLLEAIANDASALLPLLENNAAELEEVRKKAMLRGQILSQSEIDLLNKANDKLSDTKYALKGLKHQIGLVGAEFMVMAGPGMSRHIDALNLKLQNFDLTVFVASTKHSFLVFEETAKQAISSVKTEFRILLSSLHDRWPTQMEAIANGWSSFSSNAKTALDATAAYSVDRFNQIQKVWSVEISAGDYFNSLGRDASVAFDVVSDKAVSSFQRVKTVAEKDEAGRAYLGMWSAIGDGVDSATSGMLTQVKARFSAMENAATIDAGRALTPWEQVKTGITAVWGSISPHMASFYSAMESGIRYVSNDIALVVGDIRNAWSNGTGIMTEVARTAWDVITGSLRVALNVVEGDFAGAWSIVETGTSNFVDRVGTKLRGAFEGVFSTETFDVLGTTIDGVGALISDVADGIAYAFKDIMVVADELGKTLDANMWWISGTVDTVWTGIKTIVKTAWDLVVGTITVGLKLLRGDFSGAWDVISGGIDSFVSDSKQKLISLAEYIQDIPSKVLNAGKEVAAGLANGIKSKASDAADAAKDMAQGALDSVISVFDIHSPSRETRQLGVFAGEGLVIGIKDQTAAVASAASDMADAAKSSISDNLKADHAAYVAASRDRIAESKARLEAMKAQRAAEREAETETNESSNVLERVAGSTGKFTTAKEKLTKATKKQTEAEKTAEDKRTQALKNLEDLRKSTALSTIEREKGTDAMDLQRYKQEGLTASEAAESVQLGKLKAANESAIQSRDQAITSLKSLRQETSLSTIAREKGTDAMKLEEYRLGSLTVAEAAESLQLEKTKAANDAAVSAREQAVASLVTLRKETALSTIAREKGADAMKLAESKLGSLTNAEAKEKLQLEKTKSANEAMTLKRQEAISSLTAMRHATLLSTTAREKGTDAMKLQQYELESLTAVEATEMLQLINTKAANDAATQAREQAVMSLQTLRKEAALSTIGREKDTDSMKLQRYEQEGLTAAEALERLALEETIAVNDELAEQRINATEAITELNQQLEYETILLYEGSEAAELFKLKIEGYSDAQAKASITTKQHIADMQSLGDFGSSIGDTLTEGLLSGDWKSAGQSLLSTLQDTFVSPLKNQIGSAISQAMSGGGTGGFSSILGSASSAGGAGGSGIMGMLTGGGASSFLGAGTLGFSAGQAIGQTGIGTGLGAMIGNFILPGIGGFVGAALGGVVESLFGGKKEQTDGGFELGYSADEGVSGQNYQSFKKKKSFWRGTKRWTEYSDLDSEVATQVGDYFDNMESSIVSQVESFGVSSADEILSGLEIESAKFSGDNAEEDMQNWLIDATKSAYEVAYDKLPTIVQDAISGASDVMTGTAEEISERFAYVGQVASTVSPLLKQFGMNISSSINQATLESTQLADAMGGIQQVSEGLSSVYNNLMSPAEQFSATFAASKDTISDLNDTLGLTGSSVLDTKEELLSYIKTLDLSQEGNVELAAEAMAAASAMGTFSNAMSSIEDKFSSTIDSFEDDLLSQEEKHAKYMNQTADLMNELKSETDPGRIAEITDEINTAANSAWSNMTDDQKTDNLDYIKRVFDVATNRSSNVMGIAPDTILNSENTINEALETTVSSAVQPIVEPAEPVEPEVKKGLFSGLISKVKKLFNKGDDTDLKTLASSALTKLDNTNSYSTIHDAWNGYISSSLVGTSPLADALKPAANDTVPTNLPSNVTSINQQLVDKTQAYSGQQQIPAETKVNITIEGSSAGNQSDAEFINKVEAAVQRAMKKHHDDVQRKQYGSSYDIRIS